MSKDIVIDNKRFSLDGFMKDSDNLRFSLNLCSYNFKLIYKDERRIIIEKDQKRVSIYYAKDHFLVNGKEITVSSVKKEIKKVSKSVKNENNTFSPMPGRIIKVLVKKGQIVKKGETLLVMEAMKIEHTIKAPKEGVIDKILFNVGDHVDDRVKLIELKSS